MKKIYINVLVYKEFKPLPNIGAKLLGFRGIFKKVLIFVLVGVGNIIDVHVIKNGSAIRTAVIFFYVANEGISIIENAAKIGLPIPQKLKDILEQLKKEGEDNES